MPANNSKWMVHYWQGKYGNLGHLYSVGKNGRCTPYPHLPYALDNGAFPAFTKGIAWDEAAWIELLEWSVAQEIKPLWALCPDVVTNPEETFTNWSKYEPIMRDIYKGTGVKVAFAAQDGMRPGDVPSGADVCFVGGSTEWKWGAAESFCASHPRVHIGRVNSPRRLAECASWGAESVDGTGWFRGDANQLRGLESFLAGQVREVRSDGSPSSIVPTHTNRGSGRQATAERNSCIGKQETIFDAIAQN